MVLSVVLCSQKEKGEITRRSILLLDERILLFSKCFVTTTITTVTIILYFTLEVKEKKTGFSSQHQG